MTACGTAGPRDDLSAPVSQMGQPDDEATAARGPATDLGEAVELLGRARIARMIAGDADGARRLSRLAELVDVEAELLDGIAHHGLAIPDRRGPIGAALGWWLRHDGHTRT